MASASSIVNSPGALDELGGDVEFGVLTGEAGRLVVLGEADLHELLVAGLHAGDLVLEAGDEAVRAELHLDALALAAVKLDAIDAANEIHRHPVALGGGGGALVVVGARRLGHPLDRRHDVGVGHLGDLLLDRDVGMIGKLDLRENLEGDRVFKVGLGRDDLLDLGLLLREADGRLEGELQAVVRDDLAIDLVDGILEDVGHHRLAVHAAQMLLGNLAGAETGDVGALLERHQLVIETTREIPGGHHHLVLALQALGQGFGDLHS